MGIVRWMSLLGIGVLLLATGCNTVGPPAVRGALVDYNKAVSHATNEQLLLNLVRMRYGEPPLFLQLGSLSTQYNLAAGAQFSPLWERADATVKSVTSSTQGGLSRTRQTGPGSSDEYGHGATISYYERPTVTYTPLQGEAYVKQVLSPIPGESLVLMISSGWSIERAMNICVQRMNDLKNAPSASGPTPAYKPVFEDFIRATALMRDLQTAHHLTGKLVDREGRRTLLISFPQSAEKDPRACELKQLWGLPNTMKEVPMVMHWPAEDPASLGLQTRSLFGVLHYLSHAVQPPEEHLAKGYVVTTRDETGQPFDWNALTGKLLTIHASPARPKRAFVAVRYEDHWFYIEKADTNSKFTFAFLSALFHLQTGEVDHFGPTLTLPVGS